jgi:microcystin-dependent protein
MACTDCLNNCADKNLTDKCVANTIEDNDTLDICEGTSLFTVNTRIFEILVQLMSGTGITLTGLTGCGTTLPSTNTALSDIIQAIYTAICNLRDDVDGLEDVVNAPTTWDTDCLEDLPTSPTTNDIIQATINKVCDVDTRLTTIEDDYVKNSDLCDLVDACLSGSTTQYNTRMVPYTAVPYHGPLSNFSASGTGLSANGYDKIYLCVGQTVNSFVLPDYRGRSPLGANTNIPGGALDSAVDPSLSANAGYSVVAGTKKGSFTDTLTVAQSPAHTHSVNDSGHTHTVGFGSDSASGNNFANYAKLDSSGTLKTTSSATTGISINSAGGNQPHNSTHPVIGCHFIMYIP